MIILTKEFKIDHVQQFKKIINSTSFKLKNTLKRYDMNISNNSIPFATNNVNDFHANGINCVTNKN